MSATQTKTSTWAIDSAHSAGEFAVKHMMISTVRGHFKITEGQIAINEENHTASSVSATIDPKSLNTREEKRDAHLQSGDFFETEKNPTITFQSTRVEKISDTDWKVFGNLTFHGMTKEVALDVEEGGEIKDPYGKQRRGFTAETTINRSDWGVTYNAAREAGGVMVSDKVKITLDISAVRQD
ncbi:MAG: YceI family protein [Thermomicrobiales bacterium]